MLYTVYVFEFGIGWKSFVVQNFLGIEGDGVLTSTDCQKCFKIDQKSMSITLNTLSNSCLS